MPSHTAARLATSLANSRAHAAVSPRSASIPPITVAQYKATHFARANLYQPDSIPLHFLYELQLPPSSLRESIMSTVADALRDYTLNDRVQVPLTVAGYSFGDGFPVDAIVDKLVELAVLFGPEDAARAFMSSLSDQRCSLEYFLLFDGVSTPFPIEIYDGIRLVPLPTSSAELPGWLPPLTVEEIPITTFLGSSVLAIRRSVSPRYQIPSQSETLVFKTESTGDPQFDEEEFCRALSLACQARVQSKVRWQNVHQKEIAALHGGGSRVTSYNLGQHSTSITLSEETVSHARALYESLRSLEQKTRRAIDVPLTRWIASLENKTLVDQVIDLGIALEAIYAGDGSEEVGFRLRIRAAHHLRQDVSDRKAVIHLVRQLYRLRSQAVHNGQFSGKRPTVNGKAVEREDLARLAGIHRRRAHERLRLGAPL